MSRKDETSGFEIVDAASPAAQAAMRCYVEESLDQLPHGFTVEEALTAAATSYNPPHGLFVAAGDEAGPRAGGGLSFLDAHRAEVKRMWVAPRARGSGLAAALLRHLERLAVEHGRTTMVLDTNSALRAAVALYEHAGYRRIPAYNVNPDADVWFEKTLTSR